MKNKKNESQHSPFIDDFTLAQRAHQGDERALRQLADQVLDRVRSTAYCLAGGDHEFEDYAQQALIEILKSSGTFRGDSSIESWANQITVRTVIRHLKQRRSRARVVELRSELPSAYELTLSAEDSVTQNRVSRRITRLLSELKPKYRVVLTLKNILGHSIEEIVSLTDTNPHTIDYRLRRGREQLRKKIKRDPMLTEWMASWGGKP